MARDVEEGDTAYIGKCERLFCVLPAERTVYCPIYERQLTVCQECYDEKTGQAEIDKESKRYQYGEIAREHLEDNS